MSDYDLDWFLLMTYRETSYVWYGVGKWSYHLMDWRGCNFHHGRIPSPVFKQPSEAMKWLIETVDGGRLREGMQLSGHHAGEFACSKGCDRREVGLVYIRGDKLDEKMNATWQLPGGSGKFVPITDVLAGKHDESEDDDGEYI